MTKDCGEREARCANNNEDNGSSDELVVPSFAVFAVIEARGKRSEGKLSVVLLPTEEE